MWWQWGIHALSWPRYSWLFTCLTETSIEGTGLLRRCWHNYECDGEAEKAFTKWVPGMFTTILKSLIELYICTRGLFWRKCSLNNFTVLYFSEIKWFWEHFEATAYTYETVLHVKLDWGCSRTRYWEECLHLRGRKLEETGEIYVMNRILTCY